ncbi:MAG: fumarate hydratase [Spirochaetaceae bacterium]|jgi:fumarate hydratase subunit alpha|nr:fumarate hydratase [Spirochaetaceae bacterium]
MRNIQAEEITEAIAALCIEANRFLPKDVEDCLRQAEKAEENALAKNTLGMIIKNFEIAAQKQLPICQDTGVACVFMDIGQEVHIEGDLHKAVDEGVRRGYGEGYLRKSVVADPVRRGNTGDNTPAMLYLDLVPGDTIKISLAPKGFGSENMSKIAMLKPSDGLDGLIGFVLQAVKDAGPNPCPPIIAGIGIGGTFDKAAFLAKKALLRPIGSRHTDPFYADLEKTLLQKINALDIGPQGFGGKTTALFVAIETMPTHIAGMPVALNINCHVARHASLVL